jgi:magnesium transporter
LSHNAANAAVDEELQEKRQYAEEIAEIVRSDAAPRIIQDKISNYHNNDIADSLDSMTISERQRLYRILDVDELSDVFEYIEEDIVHEYLSEMNIRKQAALISELDSDKAVDILRHLQKDQRDMLISLMDNEQKREVAMLSSFDEEQIGSRMTTNYICINKNLTVPEAMQALVKQAADNDNISMIYTVDDKGIYYGAIILKDLIIARKNEPLSDLIATSYPYVYAKESLDDCIEWIKDYSEDSIPALDDDNRILGIITSNDLVQVVDEQMGEDYAKLAGLTAEEDLREPIRTSIRKRLPWLVILLFLGMLVSSVVGMYEHVVAELTIVMFFQSMILDMAGNVGTQSLAVTIRVLMDDELKLKDKADLVWKECRIGLLNGLILGTAAFVLIGFYCHFFKGYIWNQAYGISICVGLSLLIAMMISSLIGTLVPILFKKIHIDPAVASGPLITTINDLVAVITYYTLALELLINVMHL